ncbi:MAG: TIGR03560 family F420-dependent LLM class oxidoreductase [Chloroflexi bacterium]|nr:TIGR03560 family F420-dependent LLM class oxidoreductase [Chloroflexota bacterium]
MISAMTRRATVGFYFRPQTPLIGDLVRLWRMSDESTVDRLWGFDHLLSIGRGKGKDPTLPVYEGLTLLTAMATLTRRVRVGLMVVGNLYRSPSLVAKAAVTVDHLSNGRLDMGFGAAWKEDEFRALGMPFPDLRERSDRFEEACAVLKMLWTADRASFEGRHYTLRDAIAEPKPVQKPHPPLWIGGSGPKRTLRTAARFADAWNSPKMSFDENIALGRVLDGHCAAIGRDPRSILRSVEVPSDPDAAQRAAEAYLAAGVTDFVLRLDDDDLLGDAERKIRDLVPRLQAL